MGAMQNYVMRCDVRSWGASGVMFDKTHCDRRSNNDWQDPLLVLVDKYLVDFLLKDKGVVEHCLRSCPRQVQEVELETFTSRSWSKGESLTEGIRASAQVEFCSQLGTNVRCPEIVTMNFVQETLPNLIIRPLLLVTRVSPPWNVQTVVCLSPNSVILVQRNHSNLPLLPTFFWKYLLSLSLSVCLFFLPFIFCYSVPRLPHRKHIQ